MTTQSVWGSPSNPQPQPSIFSLENVGVTYHGTPAIQGVTMDIYQNQITGFIGPSGCGKSSLLRCFNRLNSLIPDTQVMGRITFHGQELKQMNPVSLRRRIGMVFQRPNPFPKSIYHNIAVGLRVNHYNGNIDERVEQSLAAVGLWEEVKNKLHHNALELSGGQQQRLCIARTLALNPEVILMDEPTSSLDPISAGRIDDLLMAMKRHYTIIIVTHNLKQAALISDRVAFFNVETIPNRNHVGRLVEYAPTLDIFVHPSQPATWEYVIPGSRYAG
ncbi:phosphate ABC transporter ATP-binding protein [Spirulina sp. CS-785/01]|uniref:phosphate ABC transporter ATP-binding protein n=1 Tax=Spirulina sp. CS-785/01 TaxID=3021716 RepID=UPI00232B5C2E|nr:phosphate ABC transporter ATP-binding protein [Spirulina sp. CS-785/01]MDB9315754.1 phosphate ABC transporter ATP-binding protein [Spirulina sp. CS-785/01]